MTPEEVRPGVTVHTFPGRGVAPVPAEPPALRLSAAAPRRRVAATADDDLFSAVWAPEGRVGYSNYQR
jgi:hypothetical protein